jgi:hypothetical protein
MHVMQWISSRWVSTILPVVTDHCVTTLKEAQRQAPIRRQATLRPLFVKAVAPSPEGSIVTIAAHNSTLTSAPAPPPPNVFVLDMGKNHAGVCKYSFTGTRGASITMRYGELLWLNGTLNVLTSVAGQIKGHGRGHSSFGHRFIEGQCQPEIAWQADTMRGACFSFRQNVAAPSTFY